MPPRVDRERNRCSGEASGGSFVRSRMADEGHAKMIVLVSLPSERARSSCG